MNQSNIVPSNVRIASAIVDALLCFFVFFLLISFVTKPIVNVLPSFTETTIAYNEKLLGTGLYYLDESEVLRTYIYNFDLEKVDEYDNHLISFYEKFSQDEIDDYLNRKKEATNIFEYDEESQKFDVIGNKEETEKFYYNEYETASNYYLQKDTDFKSLYNKLQFIDQSARIITIIVSLTIWYLVFPMIFKGGETLGKKMFKIRLINFESEQFVLSKSRLFIRFLCFALVEVMLSFIFFGIPLIISIIMMIFTSNKVSLHDLVSRTIVVNKRKVELVDDRL